MNFANYAGDNPSTMNGWSTTDAKFVELCKNILASPFSDQGLDVRPKWEDGKPAHTRKVFGVAEYYDLRDGKLPILQLRPINWKAALDEIFWIYQKCSNNIHDLNSHIWDSWADESGSIGKAYGYQIGKKASYGDARRNQMEAVLHDLTYSPMSRSILTNMYCHEDLHAMHLRPCVYSVTFNVTHNDQTEDLYLNAVVNQRSNDVMVANNWNVCQYAMLVIMVAHCTGLKPGFMVHMIADAHIYDRHEEHAKELIRRYEHDYADGEGYQPTMVINPSAKNWWTLTIDDIEVRDYYPDKRQIKLPVAI